MFNEFDKNFTLENFKKVLARESRYYVGGNSPDDNPICRFIKSILPDVTLERVFVNPHSMGIVIDHNNFLFDQTPPWATYFLGALSTYKGKEILGEVALQYLSTIDSWD